MTFVRIYFIPPPSLNFDEKPNEKKIVKFKQVGEFKQIQEILSKIGTEIFKIDEEMTEKNETEDGNSISLNML